LTLAEVAPRTPLQNIPRKCQPTTKDPQTRRRKELRVISDPYLGNNFNRVQQSLTDNVTVTENAGGYVSNNKASGSTSTQEALRSKASNSIFDKAMNGTTNQQKTGIKRKTMHPD
jgi:hypothetical protein